MSLLDLIRHPERSRRLAEIAGVLNRYRLSGWIEALPLQQLRDLMVSEDLKELRGRPLPERLRLALTDLGPTFIKLGQVLSTRADLVGPEIAAELRQLQAETPADPPEVVAAVVQAELGEAPDVAFAEFDLVAFSSASIGQVHRAKLADGRTVVVKVQHDNIQDKVQADLELLVGLAEQVQKHVPSARGYQPLATARDFQRTLLRELDYTAERRNLERFTRNFAGDATVHIPEAYKDQCSRRVLTMELLEGIPGSKPDRIRESGLPLNEFAKAAANIFLNMIFRDGFYHADPHPGNFMVMEDGVLGLLDCGMVGRIDDSMRELFESLFLLLLEGDSEGLSDLLLEAGSAPPDVDRTAFRADISDLLVEYGTQSLDEFDIGGALNQLTGIIRTHHIIMPAATTMLIKTLVMLEGTSRELSPTFSLAELLAPFKEKLIQERLDPRRWKQRLQRSFRDIDRLVKIGPRSVADILERIQSGNLKVKHEHEHLEVIANRLVAGLLIASLFLGSSLLLSSGFPPQVFDISIFGLLGGLAAVLLGGRMLWVISKE